MSTIADTDQRDRHTQPYKGHEKHQERIAGDRSSTMPGTMSLAASLISQTVGCEPDLSYAKRLAAEIEPGQYLQTTQGRWLQVLQKTATADWLHYSVSVGGKRKNLSLMDLAALEPMTEPMRRLAQFVRMAEATGAIGEYVAHAIKDAGLPLDPAMDWDKYLRRMYQSAARSYTADQSLIDEAILDLVVTELYQRQILSPDSPFAHFNPNHVPGQESKPLEKKVTAYLIMVFSANKGMVVRYIRRSLGVGALGDLGCRPTESLDGRGRGQDSESSEERNRFEIAEENKDVAAFEEQQEVQAFLAAFKQYILEKSSPMHAKLMNVITDLVARGADRTKVRSVLMENPKYLTQNGKEINLDTYNFLIAKWGRGLREFASDPRSTWSKTPIGRAIASRGVIKDRSKTVRKKPSALATLAALRTAAAEVDEPIPHEA